jgi:hypothetical protein
MVKSIRPMTKDDIEAIRQPSNRGAVIAKLRDSHHIVARCFASGLTLKETAERTGYSLGRLTILKSAPAMVELVARYRDEDTAAWRESRDHFYDYVHSAGVKAWRMINDQLDEADQNGEPIPLKTLQGIGDSAADRTGPSKKSTNININADFASKLEAAINRSKQVIHLED